MAPMLRVWDPLVRGLHWSLVASITVSWLGTFAVPGVHQPGGWLALAIVLLRLLWGAVGSEYARFGQFVRGPRATWAYLLALLQRREARHLGHNPLGACMVLALLACIAGLGLSGWLYTTDAFWGDATVDTIHQALAWLLLALILLHVGGVVVTGRRQGENLARAMITGRKPAATPRRPTSARR
jgi:cytochrome b